MNAARAGLSKVVERKAGKSVFEVMALSYIFVGAPHQEQDEK